MLYELTSPLFTLAALMVMGGVVYSAKTFFDRKLAELECPGDVEAEI
ncbi:MAG: hypothetical protein R3175_03780 [Marinobacter sp.]|nr:hypothetical protein [Marinobacter sp.]MDX1755159.1 hypothetical protein [Marinobacter sp.]